MKLLGTFFVLLVGVASSINAESLNAHTHGEAFLELAIVGEEVQIQITSAAHSFLGFEHEPRDKKEKAIYAKSLLALEKIEWLPKNAQCKSQEREVHSSLEEEHHEEEEGEHEEHGHDDHDEHEEEGHFEIVAHYAYLCKSAQKIAFIETKQLFQTFDSLNKIQVQWIKNNAQGATVLSAKQTRIVF